MTSTLSIDSSGNVKKCAVGKYPKSEKLGSAGQAACCACAHSLYFDGADSGWGGTGIYLYNSTMDMYGGKIIGGYASGNGGGGAIALDDVNCIFNMYGGEISGNRAKVNGGAIFLNDTSKSKESGTVNLYGGTISKNSAANGGAIYAVYCGSVNIYGGTISNNKASKFGGAILLNFDGQMTMSGGTITGNEAADGGAIYLQPDKIFGDSAQCTLNMSGAKSPATKLLATEALCIFTKRVTARYKAN